jgi:gluconolactonase
VLRFLLPFALLATVVATASAQSSSVVRLDPTLDALVAPDAKLELVRGDFGFTEGTVWVTQGRWTSAMPANSHRNTNPP